MFQRIKHFFLFQRRPGEDWSKGKRAGFWVWNVGFVVLSSVGAAAVSLLLAVGPYPLDYMDGYWERPIILVLNILPAVFLGLLFYALTRRPAAGYLLNCLVVLGLSVANFYKLMFRDDPLLFTDLTVAREAAEMLGRYRLFMTNKLGACLLAAALGFLFMLACVRGQLPRRGQMTGVIGLLAAAGCLLSYLLCTDTEIYEGEAAYFDAVEHRWSATEQYIARGFLYPFLYSTNGAVERIPKGYREAAARAVLDRYEDTDIPEDQKVNVVCVMLEAYNDFTRFGVPELTHDVYEVWHQLEDEGYSGNLVTNIFAGGTVDTERSFLTGFSSLPDFRGTTNSYAWYFQDQGYLSGGLHPSFQWFYNRININKHLGFQRYLYVENYFGQLTGGKVAFDSIFFPELIREYEEVEKLGKPYFCFSVSYQGHGPYNTERCWWGERGDFVVDDGTYSDEQQYILDNYFGSIEDTNEHLKELTDYFREDGRPVVLVLFGDHNPWMGDGGSLYRAMGVDMDLSTEQGFLNYYSTRYIIWANDAAKEILGNDFQGEGPELSPCFLMNQVFELCGWTGPAYMQAIQEAADRVPIQNIPTGRCFAAGSDTDELTVEEEEIAARYRQLEYYYQRNFRYNGLEQDYEWID